MFFRHKVKLLILLLFINSSPLFGQEIVRIAVGEFDPLLSEKLANKGVAAQIITDIFASVGYKVEFTFLPWGRAYEEAKQGGFDGTAIWLKKPEREVDFHYSDPLIPERHVFFHLKSYPFDWKTIDDLKGIRIGGGLKHTYGEEFDNAVKQGKIILDKTDKEINNFKKLLRGRVDIYPLELFVGYGFLKSNFSKEEIEKITYHPKALVENYSHLLLTKKSGRSLAILGKFNEGLKILKKSGKYDQYLKSLVIN